MTIPKKPGRRARALCGVAAGLAIAGCGDSTSAKPLVVPAFVVVGDTAGTAQLYRVEGGVITRLSTTAGNDVDPKSAAGRIVFSTDRDANYEVYIDITATVSRRVTNTVAQDDHPALSPDGATIVFVSNRSGTPRLWTVPAPALDATTFDAPTALVTGSDTAIPEGLPAWSPDGTTLAFNSTRGGTSQIYTMAAAGGTAVQVTNEVGGAFDPAWSADGATIVYTSATGTLHLRQVKLSTSTASDFATDSLDLAAATCDANVCVAAEDPSGTRGSILAFPPKGGRGEVVIARTRNEREPAILVP
ncbi:MAG: PD40 domain-containing protein [Gemmatimonadaceae bacterium]|nr:PD40 domain-containing protein [Gemmatimonadaceae bacterium]